MLSSKVTSIPKWDLSSQIPEHLNVFSKVYNFRTENDGTKVMCMFVYQLSTLQRCVLMMFGWFASVAAIYRCWSNSVISGLLDCAISTQANPLRFTQTALIYSGAKRKVGAQTCKFHVLIMIRLKVMSFRTHAQILLMSWGEVDFCKQCNLRTKQDEGKLTYKPVT